jgi:tetratricopeptide (TPR) repeat protein
MAFLDFLKAASDLPHSEVTSADSANQERSTEPTDDRIKRWRKVIDLYPNDHKAVLALCEALNDVKQYEEADKHLARLTVDYPEERNVMYSAARQHMRRRRDQDALQAWIEIDKRWPNNIEPLQNIGALMIRCDQAKESIGIAKQLLDLDLDRSERLLVRAYRKLENYQNLLELLKTISARRALDADESAAMILALSRIEGHEAAIKHATSARDAYPRHAGIALELTNLLSCADQFSEALKTLETHASTMNEIHLHAARRATLLAKLGRLDEADECAENALNDNPNDKDLLLAHARIAQARFTASRETA